MATKYQSDAIVPPGLYLQEVLGERSLTEDELARRSGLPATAIHEISLGSRALTAEIAKQFEELLGVPASLWIALERDYRQALANDKARTA